MSRDALGELAAYGQNCASKKLAAYLNRQLCSAQQKTSGYTRPGASPNAWRICASYYAELTDEQPPKLVRRCRHETDDSGAFGRACHHWWVANDYETGHWCKDQDASCEESDVGTEAESFVHNAMKRDGNR